MSKLFVDTIIQHGGDLSDADKISVLNIASKAINKKMKILEYKHGIVLKIERLPINNYDCLPRKIGIQGVTVIDGPIKGHMPFYTQTNISIPTPTLSPITTGVPLTPYGPVVGVPSLGINPFGNTNKLKDRIEMANKVLDIIKEIDEKLSSGIEIDSKDPLCKYFEKVDLEEPEFSEEMKKILEKK